MYTQSDPTPLPLTDPRYPGLRLEYARSGAKKTDPDYKDRIVSDDTQFDIFKTPDTSFLKDAQIDLIDIQPFTEYTKGVAFLDAEWMGCDGGQAKGDRTDVLVAIGLKCRGKHYTACNRAKTERELLEWFFKQLAALKVHTVAGYASYGFFRDGYEPVPVDFAMIYYRAIHNGVRGCPWKPKQGNFATYRWNNAIVFGKPLEVPAWECDQYELVDIYPQIVLYDSLVRKLDNYRLKDAVIGFGLRKDKRIEIGHDIYNYYNRGETETIKEYLEYDLTDTELLWNFLIPQKYFMRQYMDMPLQRITTTGTGSWWNQYLIKATGKRPEKTQTCGYQGALTYYHAGVVRNAAKFDFSALYPSIMRTWLICSLKDEGYTSLKTLQFLLTYRKTIKKSEGYKKFLAGSKDADALDADGQQHTAKILANSLYGLWNTTGLAYNDPYAGAAITAYGRQLTRYMIGWLETHGCTVHAVDTDAAVLSFNNDTYKDDIERDAAFEKLAQELNATMPGVTGVEYEDMIPLMWVPPNLKDKKASQVLADKLNSIDCYTNVSPDSLDPGLSKNYLYFVAVKDKGKLTGEYSLKKKGVFKKRGKKWINSGFVIEYINKLFYDGEEVAIAFAQETRRQIANGELPLIKLQETVLVATSHKTLPSFGFAVGTRPTIHYCWRGEYTGKRVIKKVFVPTADEDETYAPEYYLDKFDEVAKSLPHYDSLMVQPDQLSLLAS
jgi:DNA polymerase family B